ncbi:PREDICTED: tripartite motif-containing protein 49-like [Chrysochloris asiatica]|uniref:Tripartite motif-containing protein 49-like n=1 Tax=Chrysochloris asiatica TaxID=185453 RepID=A0A9B0TWC5_CHRAS|nr:PREDICTED: tripartite motif-containing protein 49-like [Chrysochloris asiatica]
MYFTFKNKFTCPICKDLILDPVIIGCGHSFCRPCLYLLWEDAENPPCCPVCRESSYKINFKTSIALKKQAFVARVKGLTHLPSSEQQMCMIHMKTKDFFCEVVKDTVCRTCSKSEGHKSHRHSSIPWIAEEYRQKLLEQMRLLWEKMQENKMNLTRETNKIRTWEDHVALRRKMICADFQKEFPLSDREERMYLQKLEYESKEIFHQLNKSENCMARKGELLRKVYKELKEMCHQPDIELIQHFEELKERKLLESNFIEKINSGKAKYDESE